MGQTYPRYLTYKAGELEAELARLGDTPAQTAYRLRVRDAGSDPSAPLDRQRRLKEYDCPVSFPDGTTGTCRYQRLAPAWHVFRYEHTGADGTTRFLPRRTLAQGMENTVPAIEAAAQQHAAKAFAEAIEQERTLYFQRAMAPSKAKPERPQMKAKRAKDLAGRYALCQPVGEMLLPVTSPVASLEEANAAWIAEDNHQLVVACCCRWSRRWERPRYNPFHAHPDYPKCLIKQSDIEQEEEQGDQKQEDAEEEDHEPWDV